MFKRLGVLSAVLALTAIAPTAEAHHRTPAVGSVYTMTNDATDNHILIYDRAADGTLDFAASVSTGGRGSGAGLGSQGAIILGAHGRRLFAVNAGSNEISSFVVENGELVLADSIGSGGVHPTSLTIHDDVLYVLNTGVAATATSPAVDGNITGFFVNSDGELRPIPRSTQSLGTGFLNPAEVQFDVDGDVLVVSERTPNLLATFTVDRHGLAHRAQTIATSGASPFGFGLTRDTLVVSEPGSSATSSYHLRDDGQVTALTRALGAGQAAPCWVVISRDGHVAYVANTGGNSVSAYALDRRGNLSLVNATAALEAPGAGPADMALAHNGRFLYVRNGNGTLSSYRVDDDGALSAVQAGLPLGQRVFGLAAY